MKYKTLIALSLTALSFTGCSFVPNYQKPNIETPEQWSDKEHEASSIILYDWWKSFGSKELDALMEEALKNNTGLLAGLQRIEQARAALKIAGATLLPSIDGSANASRSRTNPNSGASSTGTSLSTGLSVAYEIDLFGANRATQEAAKEGWFGSIYDQKALELTLIGDVASTYFTLINLRERLKIADNNLKNTQEILRIIQARVDSGSESDLELAQQKTAVASNESSRATIAEQLKNTENALAVLSGKPPQSITIERKTLNNLTIPDIAPMQPSLLLERRPDLLSAEADLRAAEADIGVARAAFFPSLSLGANGTISSNGFSDPSATVLSLTSTLAAPIFQGGRLKGGLEQATAKQLELVQTYRGNVLTAFQEVEDALAAVKAAQVRETALKTAAEQARRAYSLSKNRYDAGAIDFQTLLDTQTSQLNAEDSYAQARLSRLNTSIVLYLTLGGGWKSEE